MPLKSWDEIVRTLSRHITWYIWQTHKLWTLQPYGFSHNENQSHGESRRSGTKIQYVPIQNQKMWRKFRILGSHNVAKAPRGQSDATLGGFVKFLGNLPATWKMLQGHWGLSAAHSGAISCCRPFLLSWYIFIFWWPGNCFSQRHLSFPPATCLLKFQNIFEQKYQMHSIYKVHTPQKNTSTSPCVYSHFPWAPLRCLVVSKP